MFSDDYKWVATGPGALHNLLLSVFILDLLGVPLSYEKVSGGFELEWVGYALDYSRFQAGISESRAQWLETWLHATLKEDGILVSDLVSVLGRLGFAAGPLERVRPFLSLLYSWVAAVPSNAKLKPPEGVRLVLEWLRLRFARGDRM